MNRNLKRGVVIWIGMGLLMTILLVVIGLVQNRGGSDDTLDTFYPAPEFILTDQTGQLTTLEDLRGQVWVADFFFTSCPGICPVLSQNMRWLQDELADHPQRGDLRLVSFSLDPETDTVEVLADYAEAIGAAPDEWLFLTGERETIWSISEDGFKLGVSDTPDDPANPISHNGKIVLVDRAGNVRGYYDGLTLSGVEDLKRDLLRLVEEE